MRTISRMTTSYSPREDRLRLSIVDTDNRRLVLWLTQRLVGRLIAVLLEQVERSVADDAPPSARPAMQMMEQAKADLTRKALPPVRTEPAGEEHLVVNVRMRRGPRRIALIFTWDADQPESEAVTLVIDRTRLRQWLRIFHGHYRRAGWPLELWPVWFADDAPAAVLGKEHLH